MQLTPNACLSSENSMTNVRQLYQLQELDLETGQLQNRLTEVERYLGERGELDCLDGEKEQQRSTLQGLQLDQLRLELDAETVRQKLHESEAKLYSGSVHVLRELEGMEREATVLRTRLREMDDRVLESMMALDAGEQQLKALEESYENSEEKWLSNQEELAQEKGKLEEELNNLDNRRQEMARSIDSSDLAVYEKLRTSKGGQAIALVERGLCRTCRVALPTHQLQRSRSGRETVLCNSCGRMLFVS